MCTSQKGQSDPGSQRAPPNLGFSTGLFPSAVFCRKALAQTPPASGAHTAQGTPSEQSGNRGSLRRSDMPAGGASAGGGGCLSPKPVPSPLHCPARSELGLRRAEPNGKATGSRLPGGEEETQGFPGPQPRREAEGEASLGGERRAGKALGGQRAGPWLPGDRGCDDSTSGLRAGCSATCHVLSPEAMLAALDSASPLPPPHPVSPTSGNNYSGLQWNPPMPPDRPTGSTWGPDGDRLLKKLTTLGRGAEVPGKAKPAEEQRPNQDPGFLPHTPHPWPSQAAAALGVVREQRYQHPDLQTGPSPFALRPGSSAIPNQCLIDLHT
ncbi:basic salivary proline-rich protein 3-like [Felis catus]|uniref:basic salivary proline-rich protein 3-like n=1 Tax=Felis catus TaxID=9685 RepID=UPI001D19F197|nr:basic salivary proline-rich protein 3-like [Felis catus]